MAQFYQVDIGRTTISHAKLGKLRSKQKLVSLLLAPLMTIFGLDNESIHSDFGLLLHSP